MSKYTLTIEGDFEKGECEKCPLLSIHSYNPDLDCCVIEVRQEDCPLEEVKQGEWKHNSLYDCLECSVCSYELTGYEKFCPGCGADMRGDKE